MDVRGAGETGVSKRNDSAISLADRATNGAGDNVALVRSRHTLTSQQRPCLFRRDLRDMRLAVADPTDPTDSSHRQLGVVRRGQHQGTCSARPLSLLHLPWRRGVCRDDLEGASQTKNRSQQAAKCRRCGKLWKDKRRVSALSRSFAVPLLTPPLVSSVSRSLC